MKRLRDAINGEEDVGEILQHALDAEKVLRLPCGIYRYTKPLVMHQDNQKLLGSGKKTVLLYDSMEKEALQVQASNIDISNITLQSGFQRKTPETYGNIGISAHKAQHIFLKKIQIQGFGIDILFHEVAQSSIDQCIMTQARQRGMELIESRHIHLNQNHFFENGWVKRNQKKLSGFEYSGEALYLQNTMDICLSSCVFIDNARSIWAEDVHRLYGKQCIDKNQVHDSFIYGNAEFEGGEGFDEESILII